MRVLVLSFMATLCIHVRVSYHSARLSEQERGTTRKNKKKDGRFTITPGCERPKTIASHRRKKSPLMQNGQKCQKCSRIFCISIFFGSGSGHWTIIALIAYIVYRLSHVHTNRRRWTKSMLSLSLSFWPFENDVCIFWFRFKPFCVYSFM